MKFLLLLILIVEIIIFRQNIFLSIFTKKDRNLYRKRSLEMMLKEQGIYFKLLNLINRSY